MIITKGQTRIVILTKNKAIKIPNFINGWRIFLLGLLANIKEVEFGRTNIPKLCPILWYIPGGWLITMPRVKVLTFDEFMNFDIQKFKDNTEFEIPVDAKYNNFGWLNDRIVAIDYG